MVNGILALTLAFPLIMATSHAAGVPSSKATFQTSELVLIPETTGTSDWETVLSGIIKTAENKDMFIAREADGDAYASIDACVGKLERQLTEHKKKFRNRKHPET